MVKYAMDQIEFKKIEDFTTFNKRDSDKKKFEEIRKIFGHIADILRETKSKTVHIEALCDILKMYAGTEHFFTSNSEYRKSYADQVIVRRCDVRHRSGENMDKFY